MTKLASYASYKDSGVDWLGRMPAHWNLSKFRHCFRESSEANGTEIVGEMLSVSGFRGVEPKVYEDKNQKRDAEQLESYRVVRKGQLAVNTMWLNYSGLGISDYDGHMSPAYRAYWVTRAVNLRYIHHLMRSRTYVDGYTSFLTGIRPNSLQMSRANLMEFPIILPPQKEQEAIANFLDRETAQIDELIGKQERLIELLAGKRQAIITHAVTKGLDRSAPTKPSGIAWLEDIPIHWTSSRLKFVVIRIEQGVSPQAAGVPATSDTWGVLKSGCVNGGVFRESENKQLPDDFIIDPTIVVRVGDLLVSRASGSPKLVGSAARVRNLVSNLILSDKTFRFVPKAKIDPDFLEWFFNSQPYREQVIGSISGAEGLANNISISALKNIQIPLPPISEQSRIAVELRRKIDGFSTLETKSRKAIQLLRERRSALISAAVTGKIDVREGAV